MTIKLQHEKSYFFQITT